MAEEVKKIDKTIEELVKKYLQYTENKTQTTGAASEIRKLVQQLFDVTGKNELLLSAVVQIVQDKGIVRAKDKNMQKRYAYQRVRGIYEKRLRKIGGRVYIVKGD